jgi:CO/xanthine dehydrogenase Mo-binding subunit
VAEVEVNTETGEVRVMRIVCAQDVGFAMNPLSLTGQLEGGISQGIGFALSEQLPHQSGHLRNAGYENLHVPTSLDVHAIESIVVECADADGPFGAKGAGELPLIPVAAAVTNAIGNAIGWPGCPLLNQLPVTPERVLGALSEVRKCVGPANL